STAIQRPFLTRKHTLPYYPNSFAHLLYSAPLVHCLPLRSIYAMGEEIFSILSGSRNLKLAPWCPNWQWEATGVLHVQERVPYVHHPDVLPSLYVATHFLLPMMQ